MPKLIKVTPQLRTCERFSRFNNLIAPYVDWVNVEGKSGWDNDSAMVFIAGSFFTRKRMHTLLKVLIELKPDEFHMLQVGNRVVYRLWWD